MSPRTSSGQDVVQGGLSVSTGAPTVDTRVPFLDLGQVHAPLRGELLAAFERVLDSSAFTGGEDVERFEAEFADRVGVSHCVGVGSGTAALQLALLAAGIGRGDEVVLPPNTFFATAEAVVATGATPVLADVDLRTGLLDPVAAAAAVTPRTAAIIAVHLHGQAADMTALRQIADTHGLFLLEDAAQAVGARWRGREVGSLGDAAAFSFYPGKNLGALGDAGAVLTSDPDLAAAVTRLRSHGEARKHLHVAWGYTERLDGLQAAFLRVKLAQLTEAQQLRDTAVARYRAALRDEPAVLLLDVHPEGRHVHHHLVVRVQQRDQVLDALDRLGVGAAVHYPTPIHRQPAFGSFAAPPLPNAEALAASILSMPLFPGITPSQVDRSVAALLVATGDRSHP